MRTKTQALLSSPIDAAFTGATLGVALVALTILFLWLLTAYYG